MYADYLSYLKHVDDTTLQELTAETERVRSECEAKIKRIEKEAEESINQAKKDSEESLRLRDEAHATEMGALTAKLEELNKKIKAEKNESKKNKKILQSHIDELQDKYQAELAIAEEYRSLYESAGSKIEALSKTRKLILAVFCVLLGFAPIVVYYIFYLPGTFILRKKYFSVKRWIKCTQYNTAWVNRK